MKAFAQRINEQKRGFKTTRNWTAWEKSHFYGLCGEAVLSIKTGLPMNMDLDVQGDRGYDFLIGACKVDVKASTYLRSPDLKVDPDNNGNPWPDVYCLVALDVKGKRGRIVGWCTAYRLRQSALKDYGNGPQLHIEGTEMKQ